jgi:DHA1 family bicyclomycin/chloramphenicol resistance-like MFS transporter
MFAYLGWHTVSSTIVFFFIQLGCLGLTFPNGSALGMAPFSKDLGSASALMGFMHICIGGTLSAIVGIANMDSSLPIAGMLFLCSALALGALVVGRPKHQ